MSEIRVRFPPSPTGYLHIGSARTALYNWLFARQNGGKLVLRIEDTDLERSTQESIQGILDGLKWLGIDWDEGPYFQSAHREEHVRVAGELLERGHAYPCFCTKEELDAKREAAETAKTTYGYDRTCRGLTATQVAAKKAEGLPFVVRFKVPDGDGIAAYDDTVYGHTEKPHSEIEDFVIVRSDGSPLYLLSNVVDDVRDRISHVIRGADGRGNTPRQILLYQALGAPVPVFAHMPLTLDHNKAKISKRKHGEIVAIHFYREHGFIPWALCNFLVLLGWSPGTDQEIFSQEELIQAFSLHRINRSNAVFNYRKEDPKFFTDPKAISINSHYLRTLPVAEVAAMAKPYLKAAGLWDADYEGPRRSWYLETIDTTRERFHTLTDFVELARAYFSDEFPIDPQALAKNLLKYPELKELLPALAERFAALDPFTAEATEQVARDFAAEHGVKVGVPINAARAVITGQVKGPSMFDIFVHLGKETVVRRLRDAPQRFT